MESEKIITPFVHLNGTSKNELVEQRRNVIQAIRAAQDALNKMSPNGRDYYSHPYSTLTLAQLQHARRATILENLREEIEREWELIEDGVVQ